MSAISKYKPFCVCLQFFILLFDDLHSGQRIDFILCSEVHFSFSLSLYFNNFSFLYVIISLIPGLLNHLLDLGNYPWAYNLYHSSTIKIKIILCGSSTNQSWWYCWESQGWAKAAWGGSELREHECHFRYSTVIIVIQTTNVDT